jgi:hypothetical protein
MNWRDDYDRGIDARHRRHEALAGILAPLLLLVMAGLVWAAWHAGDLAIELMRP